MKQIFFEVFVVSMLLITACSKTTPSTINPEVLVTATPPSQPESGKATVYGQVMHKQGYPIANIIVRLAEVARGAEGRGGAYILDIARSPATSTDINGYFSFQNIKAGEYVIVIGDVESTAIFEIIPEANGKAKVWNFPADQATDIGVLTVSIVIPTPAATFQPGPYPLPTSPSYP